VEAEFENDLNEELPEDPADRVEAIIDRVLDELDLDADVEVFEEDEEIVAEIEGEDDLGLLIGRRGQTIDALQLLCYRAAFRGRQDRKRVTVDAAGYRARRAEVLERQPY
jgi:spoIIIJ-associated protein